MMPDLNEDILGSEVGFMGPMLDDQWGVNMKTDLCVDTVTKVILQAWLDHNQFSEKNNLKGKKLEDENCTESFKFVLKLQSVFF